MKIKYNTELPKEEGYYLWKSESGEFYVVEVRRGISGSLWGLGIYGVAKVEDHGGLWSEKAEME